MFTPERPRKTSKPRWGRKGRGRFQAGRSTEGIASRSSFFPVMARAQKLMQGLVNSIKNLSRGSKVYLPVHVAGAKFSVGDLHFSRMLLLTCPFSPVPTTVTFCCFPYLTNIQRETARSASAVS